MSGTAFGAISQMSAGLGIDGKLTGFAVGIDDKRTAGRIEAHLLKRPGGALTVEDLCGQAYGGQFEGKAVLDLDAPVRYRLWVSFEGLSMAELFGEAAGDDGRAGAPGTVDGNTELSGVAGAPDERRASGRLRIAKARLLKVPILLGLVQVITLSLPGDKAYSDGHIAYHLKGDALVVREIALGGAAASIVGSGRVDLKRGTIALTFLRGPAGALPRIEGLDELLQGILGEIVEVRVTGTLDRPRVETVPLRSVKRIIDTILRPEAGG